MMARVGPALTSDDLLACASPDGLASFFARLGYPAELEQVSDNELRIVYARHGANSRSDTAAGFLKSHSRSLGFRVFDFDSEEEQLRFVDMSVGELLGEAGRPWREFWSVQRYAITSRRRTGHAQRLNADR